jgi:hypothetical protein
MKGNGFRRNEVTSIYVDPDERFVVSLVVGYSARDDVHTAEDAARTALELTQDDNATGTVWHVFDRQTQQMHRLSQREFDPAFASEDDDGDAELECAECEEPATRTIDGTPLGRECDERRLDRDQG